MSGPRGRGGNARGRAGAGLEWAALVLVVAALSGCGGERLRTAFLQNQRPVVRLTHAPAPSDSAFYYAYDVRWIGYDADGAVHHYDYCVDPPTAASAETAWVSTTTTGRTFLFRCTDADSAGTLARPGGYHVLVVEAVDDRGSRSEPAIAAFFTFTVAPTVRFVEPKLPVSPLLVPSLPPSTTVAWTGTDPDGLLHRAPLYYRYKLFSSDRSDFDYATLVAHPDLLRLRYAPAFAGWDSISGDTCRVTLDATPESEAVFAVVAFDEAGAYSPVFTFNGNLLRFLCSYSGYAAPTLSIWNEYFQYSYTSGTYSLDPARFLQLEVPAGVPVTLNWSARLHSGAEILGYRWALDLRAIDDPTPRSGPDDWSHWSERAVTETRATVGPFAGAGAGSLETHVFYLEAEDTNHQKSLGVIVLHPIAHTATRPLLIVDDTRLTLDRVSSRPDSVSGPTGNWPTAAELDTFLFAVGGVRWRFYPPGTRSAPGVFAGYDFDTLGTRGTNAVIPLETLARYRRVVWITNPAVEYRNPLGYAVTPMPMLRHMSGPGRYSTLAAFIEMGGDAWLMGGGIAYNSLLPWNVTWNDYAGWGVNFTEPFGELVPGRLIHDAAHWTEASYSRTCARAWRVAGDEPGWPAFSTLPPDLLPRSPRTDPLPPLRTVPSQFYLPEFEGELLGATRLPADTRALYAAASVRNPLPYPVMTWYRGPDCGSTALSGFPLWFFQRSQAIQVADFVLERMWGMERRPVPR